MEKNLERKCRRLAVRHAFTLIEIMIVVVIIGMLAALVGPRIIGSLDKSKVKTTQAQLASLKSAVQQFYMDQNDYPASLEDLLTKNEKGGPYLDAKTLPKDGWDNDFVYTCPGADDQDFDIISYGADKTSGGDDYDKDLSCWN